MSLARFIATSSAPTTFALGLVGLLAGAFNGGLVAVVHRALGGEEAERTALALAFSGLALGKVLSAYASGSMLTTYAQESIAAMRRSLIGKLLCVPYRHLEEVGSARVYAALTRDVAVVNAALQATPGVVVNGAILLGAGAYLLYLSWTALLAVAVVVFVGFCAYRVAANRAREMFRKERDEHDRLYGHLRSLTEGTKELKMHAARRRAFLDGGVLETTEAVMRYAIQAQGRYLAGQAVNSLLLLVCVGLILFVMPGLQDMGPEAVTGYVLAALYVMGPVSALLRATPAFANAGIALARIDELGARLHEEEQEPRADPAAVVSFERIELSGITHRYHREDGSGFVLGPVDFSLEPGELVFVTGGNGSGKSTLAKVLIGLYEPDQGEVRWDGRPVSRDNRDLYRQLFSVVFADYHVFETLLGLDPARVAERADTLLRRLELDALVQVRDGVLSATALSQGQKKRLALFTALLEDRPVYLFDEWAADQDPRFKETFYRTLVPELQAQGKAVVVITHDDRYFEVADRVVHMRDGNTETPAS